MKIVHFSDTHLGFSEYNKLDPETGINQREQDFYNSWNNIIHQIIEKKPDMVLHAGDLFHTTRPSNRAIAVAFEGIRKISDAGIPFVIVAGNHSTPKIRATGSIFEAISLFTNVNAAYQGRYQRFEICSVDIHCVPHCSLTEELEQAFHDIVIRSDAKQNVLLTHGAWAGSKNYSMGEFNEQHIPNPELKLNMQFDYIALGHYHKHITIADHIIYCGSPERTSFNEAVNTTGYMWLDLDAKKFEHIELPSRKMIKLPPLDCTEFTVAEIYLALEKLSTPELEDALVSLDLKNIQHDSFIKLDWREIDRLFKQVFHLEKTFSHIERGGTTVTSSSFDSLTVEFERYIDRLSLTDLDGEWLKKTGLHYLSEELEE
ncbi:hypothetical protein GF337_15975 [candidate division KSB1 bacterium]|nr:hypothetical protein [candidate division KSB1 bacterium]